MNERDDKYTEMPPDPFYQEPKDPKTELRRVLNQSVIEQYFHQPNAKNI